MIGASIDERDILNAHQLSSRRGDRPTIARFSRRITKVEMRKKKKNLMEIESLKNIKVFEDLTQPRSKSLSLLKSHCQIESAWIREDTIIYKWKNNVAIRSVPGLFEGGIALS